MTESNSAKGCLFALTVDLPEVPLNTELVGFKPPPRSSRSKYSSCNQLQANLILCFDSKSLKLCIFGSIDCLFIDNTFEHDLICSLNFDADLFLVSTHTHYAPLLAPTMIAMGSLNHEWYLNTINKIASSINNFNFDSTPLTSIAFSKIPSNLSVNRRKTSFLLNYSELKKYRFKFGLGVAMAPNKSGICDHNLYTLAFYNEDGDIKTLMWSLAAHNTINLDKKIPSPGYIGEVREYLRSLFSPDINVIFLPGLSGSSLPDIKPKPFWRYSLKEFILGLLPFNPSFKAFGKNEYKSWSSKLLVLVQLALSNLSSNTYPINHVSFTKSSKQPIFNCSNSNSSLSCQLRRVSINSELIIDLYNGEMLSEWLPILTKPDSTYLLSSGYGIGNCLYIPTDEEITRGGYEVSRFKLAFGIKGQFLEKINSRIVSLASSKSTLLNFQITSD